MLCYGDSYLTQNESLWTFYLLNQLISDAEKMSLDYLELQATDAGYNLYKSVGFKDVISKYHRMKIVLNEKINSN